MNKPSTADRIQGIVEISYFVLTWKTSRFPYSSKKFKWKIIVVCFNCSWTNWRHKYLRVEKTKIGRLGNGMCAQSSWNDEWSSQISPFAFALFFSSCVVHIVYRQLTWLQIVNINYHWTLKQIRMLWAFELFELYMLSLTAVHLKVREKKICAYLRIEMVYEQMTESWFCIFRFSQWKISQQPPLIFIYRPRPGVLHSPNMIYVRPKHM